MADMGATNLRALSGASLAALIAETVEGRLQRDDATHISVQPYKGRYIGVASRLVDILAGFTRSQADNRIDATGADAGAALAVDTLYYVYISNDLATFSPDSIRCSTVAPSLVSGVKYLGVAGNALNWRFLGWVRTISNGGTPNFADSTTQRLVVNYYNRRRVPIGPICPGYVDNNAYTSYSELGATGLVWRKANGGVGTTSQFISNGEDDVEIDFHGLVLTNIPVTVGLGVGVDGLEPVVRGFVYPGSTVYNDISGSRKTSAAEGYHTLDLILVLDDAAATVTMYSDISREGAAADPMATYYDASVMA